jgi:deazaflavin-dependent oxidoreductase (nitroreductase family)
MGLQQELGYDVSEANAVQRGVQVVAASKPGAWTLSYILAPLDKLVHRATKGRGTAAGVLTGLPVVMLTTTGAKSGEQRTMPVLGIPVGDDLAVIAGNFGQKASPGWAHNLTAEPAAAISFHDTSVNVIARLADDAETEETFALAEPIYGGYAKYRERISPRGIKVFILEAAA